MNPWDPHQKIIHLRELKFFESSQNGIQNYFIQVFSCFHAGFNYLQQGTRLKARTNRKEKK